MDDFRRWLAFWGERKEWMLCVRQPAVLQSWVPMGGEQLATNWLPFAARWPLAISPATLRSGCGVPHDARDEQDQAE